MSGRSAERGARPGSSPAAARARGRYAFIRAESADRRTRFLIQPDYDIGHERLPRYADDYRGARGYAR